MKRHVNLMSPAIRRRQVIASSILRAVIACLLLVVGLTSIGWVDWLSGRAAAARRAALESQFEPIKQLKSEITAAKTEHERLRKEHWVELALSTPRPPLTLIGSVSKAVAATHAQVYIKQLQYQDGSSLLTAETTGSSPRTVIVQGLGVNDAIVAQFVDELRETGVFSQVDLKSTAAQRLDDRIIRRFHVECTL